ncbi:MAG: recombination mediator RecR [Pirellulales bacterium]|jgi:recombination protein RecR|nr:recombination protein RecR [Pirellulales bacterium]MEC7294120.1 recombination mediator RecR [Planctomycetota bacterium]MDA7976345.1 recombination mediator RecR [Pirellulales bacterium]MDA7992992.1 recombination mediator RecR [Pirellulales bacterium]MDP6676118.1 recombination mediator RecR [Pirellulales bacterium]|tara:strand:- start:6778 stop:7377 length:600 start_codon:yes stop_codon:yes gene_type:complete
MAESSSPISRLIDAFSNLPSIGKKSAERLAYHVLKMPNEEAIEFAESIRAVKENLRPCKTCFNLSENEECDICKDPRRDQTILCVVEQVRDLLAIEQAGSFRGLYHVLQGRLSPLDGIGPEKLSINTLVARINEGVIREVIMGTTPNVEGDGTALAIAARLAGLPVTITRLARGLTVGASLEQANRDMLADAMASRQPF